MSPLEQPPLHIILIDDEPSVLFALRLLMQACGHQVQDFNSPEVATSYFAEKPGEIINKFDLIVCDLKMPKKSGLTVLSDAKNYLPTLPFILMSAHATLEEQEQARILGCSGFLAKPFTPAQLKELIEALRFAEAV
ncbi:MAG: response regulator [Bdellovibrionales bacterium]|nr:response regulator [Bdellovibrionales bacterium]